METYQKHSSTSTNSIPTMEFNRTSEGMMTVSELKQCRICLQYGETKDLIWPCKCSGTLQYVHQNCLKQWIIRSRIPGKSTIECELCKNLIEYKVHIDRQCITWEQFKKRLKGNEAQFCCQIFVIFILMGVLAFMITVMASFSTKDILVIQLSILSLLAAILLILIIMISVKIVNFYCLKNGEVIGQILKHKKKPQQQNFNSSISRVYPQTIIMDIQ